MISGGGNVTKMGNSDGRFVLSGNNTFSGTLTISQGRILITHASALGDSGAGTTVQSGPGLQMQGGITVAAEPLTLYGNGYWGGGALDSVSGNNTWSGPITLGASTYIRAQADTLTLNSATAITGSGYNIQFQGGGTIVVNSCIGTGAGTVTKIDNGTLVLNGTNTYSGATTLSFGTLIHNGTNTSTAVSVASGTTLMGVGSVGALTVTGTVAPGTNTVRIGRLAVSGLTMNNGSAFRVQLGDNSNTADRDFIQNSGAAPTINATVTVYVDSTLVSNWDPSQTRSWNIITGNVGSAANFSVDQTTYWNDGSFPKNGGSFSLSASGGNLVLTFSPLPNPTATSATPDIHELVRLAWTKNASYDVMIVHRATNAPTAPTQGTGYSVGDSIGANGTKVIYKGSASYLDHVMPSGLTHYYVFYSYSGNYYSPGVTNSAALTAYLAGEIVEEFGYTNNVSLGSLSGGNGWSGAWSTPAGTWTVQTNGENCMFVSMPNYPNIAGQRVKLTNPGNSGSARAERSFSAVNSGTIYASVIMAYNWEGSNKWAGLSFLNSGVETGFVGKGWGANWYTLGIASYGGATEWAAYDLRGLENSTNNTYLLIAR